MVVNQDARLHLERITGLNRVVVISTDSEYVGLVGWKRALTALLNGRLETVHQRLIPRIIAGASTEYALPLTARVDQRIRKRIINPDDYVSRRLILARDEWTCKYCDEFGDTIDHIWPKSKGGPNTWANLCAACHDCNETKGDTPLDEMGWDYPDLDLDFVPDMRGDARQFIEALEAIHIR